MALQAGFGGYNAPARSGPSKQVLTRRPLYSGTLPGVPGAFTGGPNTPARAPVSQTLAQVANQRVNQQLAPQVAAQNAFNSRQSQVIQSFANALLGKLQPIAGQVGAGYDQAIQQTGALSGAAAQYLNAANPSGQVADLLRSAGAPQAQIDQQTGQLGQTFGGGAGVLAFTGGAIPGGQLAADKAAEMGQAAQLPGLAALKGQQDLASALWQQGQDRQTLEAQRPALYQQAAQDIHTNQNARAKLAQSARQDAVSNRFKADTINQRTEMFNATQKGKAADRELKAKAADFLNWYRAQGVNATQEKIDAKAAEFGVTAGQRDTALAQGAARVGIAAKNAETSAIRANNASAPKYSSSVSRSLGRRSDQYGNPIQGGALLPGFTRKGGTIVKTGTASTGKTLSVEGLQKATSDINQGIALAANGGNFDKNGNPKPGGGYAKDGTPLPPVDRAGALAEARKHGYLSTPQYSRLVMAALNREYPPPGPGSAANLFGTSGQNTTKRATTR